MLRETGTVWSVQAKLPGLSNLPQAAAVVGDRVEENAADAEAELKQRQSAKTDAAATAIDRTREATMTDANSGRVVATGPSPDRELAGAAVGVVGKKAPEEKWLSYTSDSSFRDSSAMDGGGDSAWAAGGSDRSAVEEGEGTVTGNRAPSSASDTVAEEKAAAPVVQDELPVLPAKPYYAPIFEFLAVLGEYDNFTMAALVEPRRAGESGIRTLYVHSKTCIVDGEWATIGSANLVDLSLTPNHTEMNIAFWDGDTALGLLNELTGACSVVDVSPLSRRSGGCATSRLTGHAVGIHWGVPPRACHHCEPPCAHNSVEQPPTNLL
jgi:hypothetical protein